MKIFLILLSIHLCLISLVAQTSPELIEAEKLNENVVKLYGGGKFKDALPDAKRANAIYLNKAGKDDLRTASSFINLGQIYYQLNDNKRARSSFKDALEIYKKNIPLSEESENKYVQLLETVAMFESSDGDADGAETKLTDALKLREKINGPNSQETADVLYSLVQIYRVRGEYEKALPLLLRSIEIRTAKGGTIRNVPTEMWETTNCVLSKLDRGSEAKDLEKRFQAAARAEGTRPQSTNKISGGVVNGKAKFLAQPKYPLNARAKGISGTVTVQVLIDESGKVVFACGMSGPRELHKASESAAYELKFLPTTLKGAPVRVSGVITYSFFHR